jgi:hypothetical protein
MYTRRKKKREWNYGKVRICVVIDLDFLSEVNIISFHFLSLRVWLTLFDTSQR